MNLLQKGKVKEVYEVNSEELEFLFTNNISVFDKVIPSDISYKGETLCKTTTYWFGILEKLGIKSHFIKLTDKNRMRVKRVNIIRDYDKIDHKTTNYLIPLEFIARYYVAGSLFYRINNKKIKPSELGFSENHKVCYGESLPEPFLEVTTKLEKTDRLLTEKEGLEISGLTKDEYDNILENILKIDEKINNDVKKRGLIHVDGKKEFAFDPNRELMLIDTFGTADEDRFWDLEAYENSKFVELSKEYVRNFYRRSGYHKLLMDKRDNKEIEPDIPPLPEDFANKVSKLYINLYERITGEKFLYN